MTKEDTLNNDELYILGVYPQWSCCGATILENPPCRNTYIIIFLLTLYIYIHIGTVRTATSFRSGSVPLPVIWCRLENIIWRYGRRGVKTPSGRSSLERCTENPNVSKRPESDV